MIPDCLCGLLQMLHKRLQLRLHPLLVLVELLVVHKNLHMRLDMPLLLVDLLLEDR